MKRKTIITVFGLILIVCFGCEQKHETKNREGYVDVTGGKIWYQITGQGDKTPILMIHGGPGYPSYYLNALKPLGKDRKVILFDQLGCGRSDIISDTTLMTVDNYVEQTQQLLKALKIKNVHIYGHSWGTMLGVDYYLKYPQGIKSLILASPCLNTQLWQSDSDTLISMLPDSTQNILRNNIKGIPQDSIMLTQAVNDFFEAFYFRKQPPSVDLDSTLSQVGWNVYNHMWGTNEFFVEGTLKNYDKTDHLRDIKIPTMYIAGEYDPARPSTLKYYQSLTPNSVVSVTKNAGHVTMNDNPEEDIAAITSFLNSIEIK